MNVLDRKLVRELLGTRVQLASILLMAAVGVACYVALASSHRNLETTQRAFYERCRLAHFWVNLRRAPAAEVARLDELPGVAEARARISFEVTVDLDGVDRPLSGRVISMPGRDEAVINDIVIMRGAYFSDDAREEVIVNDTFARKRGLRVGDSVRVLLNNRLQEWRIVGTALSAEFVYVISPGGILPDSENYGLFYLEHDYAEEITDFEGAANEVVGWLEPDCRDRPDAVLDAIERRLEDYGVVTVTPLRLHPSHRFLSDEITQLGTMSVVLPSIFLAVAAMVLNILMTRLVEQQRTIVGTLKALGYSNAQVTVHYLKFGLAIGVAGGILGAALGQGLAGLMTMVYRIYFEFPVLLSRVHPEVWVVGVAISVGFAIAGTVRGVRAVVRLSPAEAMRAKAPPIGRRVWLERISPLWRALGFQWHMVLRELLRQRTRTAVGVFAASMGAALLFTAFAFNSSIRHMVNFQFDLLLLSDYDVVFEDERDFGAVYEARRSLPGVDRVEPVLEVPCELRHGHREKRVGVTGLVKDARLTVPRDERGRRVAVPESGLLVTRKLAELLGARGGDRLILEPIRGDREPREVTIVKVIDSYLGLSAYADFDYLNRLIGEEAAVSMVQMEVAPGEGVEKALFRELKRRPAVEAVNPIGEQKQRLMDTFVDNLRYSIGTLITFAAVIFCGSILTTSLISLSERRGQIGVLRVMGFTAREVGGIFLKQNLVVNLAGTAIGLPLGYLLVSSLVRVYDTELFRMPLAVGPWTWTLPVVLAILFTLGAHSVVLRSVRKMDWVEAMKARE